MKIETLINCLEESVMRFGNAYLEIQTPSLAEEKASRQNLAIRKGIIRKFERLEKKLNCKLILQELRTQAFQKAFDDMFLGGLDTDVLNKDNE